jgi:hypothetical protein
MIPMRNTTLTPTFFCQDSRRFQIALWARRIGTTSKTRFVTADASPKVGTSKRQNELGSSGFQFRSKGVQLAMFMEKRMMERQAMIPAVA